MGFPCGSAGKESSCNVGDLGSIPGLERSPREGKGYSFQYSGLENSLDNTVPGVSLDGIFSLLHGIPLSVNFFCICFVYLGQEDPLGEGMATHSSILAWRIPWTEEPGRLQSMGSQSWTLLSNKHFHF